MTWTKHTRQDQGGLHRLLGTFFPHRIVNIGLITTVTIGVWRHGVVGPDSLWASRMNHCIHVVPQVWRVWCTMHLKLLFQSVHIFMSSFVLSSFHSGQAVWAAQCLQTGRIHVPKTVYTLHKGYSENSLELDQHSKIQTTKVKGYIVLR